MISYHLQSYCRRIEDKMSTSPAASPTGSLKVVLEPKEHFIIAVNETDPSATKETAVHVEVK